MVLGRTMFWLVQLADPGNSLACREELVMLRMNSLFCSVWMLFEFSVFLRVGDCGQFL